LEVSDAGHGLRIPHQSFAEETHLTTLFFPICRIAIFLHATAVHRHQKDECSHLARAPYGRAATSASELPVPNPVPGGSVFFFRYAVCQVFFPPKPCTSSVDTRPLILLFLPSVPPLTPLPSLRCLILFFFPPCSNPTDNCSFLISPPSLPFFCPVSRALGSSVSGRPPSNPPFSQQCLPLLPCSWVLQSSRLSPLIFFFFPPLLFFCAEIRLPHLPDSSPPPPFGCKPSLDLSSASPDLFLFFLFGWVFFEFFCAPKLFFFRANLCEAPASGSPLQMLVLSFYLVGGFWPLDFFFPPLFPLRAGCPSCWIVSLFFPGPKSTV